MLFFHCHQGKGVVFIFDNTIVTVECLERESYQLADAQKLYEAFEEYRKSEKGKDRKVRQNLCSLNKEKDTDSLTLYVGKSEGGL